MLSSTKISEPIPGYVVKERIGVGGYGEVWSAQAPGDLLKAIKFVYGYFDDNRAARELKALNRIKQVRHPFLLSLERFEIVDGQLIIVTELADMSLKDRFEKARQAGQTGVPREELIGYLRDAADALDYMRANFALQHLDVKPENLLLVGGRVKVADFGLVKELHDVTASMMGGLTPVYASPEVFDDRPSEHSDQYSLAIVYQEMLTGTLPFPGRTPAQLASQHLHAKPRLTGLSPEDQAVVARALAKDPLKRFASCRAMIDSLLGLGSGRQDRAAGGSGHGDGHSTGDTTANRAAASATDTDPPRVVPRPGEGQKTVIIGEGATAAPEEQYTAVESVPAPYVAAADLPPLESPAAEYHLRPTLFVGVGGTGGRALRRLRRKLRDRLGPAASVPALQMLFFDTDVKNVYHVTQGDCDTALADAETLTLPLRNAHDYMTDPRNLLQWLSRRWLYNIPRSLQTEGRRPLGRLALVDHAPRIEQRLKRALAEMTDADALATSTATTGWPCDAAQPRVVIVSSTAGGTGGGIVLDLAYMVRKILGQLGLPDHDVRGVLTHSTDRSPEAHDLAIANTYACLSELHHYAVHSYYPGDPACDLPEFDAGQGPFTATYLLHLGDDLNDRDFDAAIDGLAAYLCLDTLTPAGTALDFCRYGTPDSTASAGTTLRSFGLACVGSAHSALAGLASELLCREVVEGWRGDGTSPQAETPATSHIELAAGDETVEPANQPLPMESRAAEHAATLRFDLEPLSQQITAMLEQELGGDAAALFATLQLKARQRAEPAGTGPSGPTPRLLRTVDNLFGRPGTETAGTSRPSLTLEVALDRGLQKLAAPLIESIRTWVLSLVDDPEARVGGACRARQWYASRISALDNECVGIRQKVQETWQSLEQMLFNTLQNAPKRTTLFGLGRSEKPSSSIDAAVVHLIRCRIQELALYGLSKLLRTVATQVSTVGDQLKDLQRSLGQLAEEFVDESPWAASDAQMAVNSVLGEVRLHVTTQLRRDFAELVWRASQKFQSEFLDVNGGLQCLCAKADTVRTKAPSILRALAHREIVAALALIPIGPALLGDEPAADAGRDRLRSCVESARPRLSGCGGGHRLLAMLPQIEVGSQLQSAVADQLQPPATLVAYDGADVIFAVEAQDMPIAHVAARLIDDRGDFARTAARLHTRTDVTWAELSKVRSY